MAWNNIFPLFGRKAFWAVMAPTIGRSAGLALGVYTFAAGIIGGALWLQNKNSRLSPHCKAIVETWEDQPLEFWLIVALGVFAFTTLLYSTEALYLAQLVNPNEQVDVSFGGVEVRAIPTSKKIALGKALDGIMFNYIVFSAMTRRATVSLVCRLRFNARMEGGVMQAFDLPTCLAPIQDDGEPYTDHRFTNGSFNVEEMANQHVILSARLDADEHGIQMPPDWRERIDMGSLRLAVLDQRSGRSTALRLNETRRL